MRRVTIERERAADTRALDEEDAHGLSAVELADGALGARLEHGIGAGVADAAVAARHEHVRGEHLEAHDALAHALVGLRLRRGRGDASVQSWGAARLGKAMWPWRTHTHRRGWSDWA